MNVKLPKKGDCMFRRDGPLLAIKWLEMRVVVMLSTIHDTILVETGKTDRAGNKIKKPESVYYYCSRMGGVNLSDQLKFLAKPHTFVTLDTDRFDQILMLRVRIVMIFLRKSTKWSRKLLIHLFKFGNTKRIYFEQVLWFQKNYSG